MLPRVCMVCSARNHANTSPLDHQQPPQTRFPDNVVRTNSRCGSTEVTTRPSLMSSPHCRTYFLLFCGLINVSSSSQGQGSATAHRQAAELPTLKHWGAGNPPCVLQPGMQSMGQTLWAPRKTAAVNDSGIIEFFELWG